MRTTKRLWWGIAVIASGAVAVGWAAVSPPQQRAAAVAVDSDDIGGVVTSANGPEAGVWVIAETNDFQTRYVKIVVTDEAGRYLVPDLPNATYTLWVRGYGLSDSPKVTAKRGTLVNLKAVVAPSPAAAAEVYPAIAWFSMMHLPQESELTGIEGGMDRYLQIIKNEDCVGCHQLGNRYTRTIPAALSNLPSRDAWLRRIQSGQAGRSMIQAAAGDLRGVPIKYLADWTDRIAKGELPTWKPPRPTGIERNVVATIWDWGTPTMYVHDLAGTDWRNPTLNGYGLFYGSTELSTDELPILDPIKNVATSFHAPVRDADTPSMSRVKPLQPSLVWGDEPIWTSHVNTHNPIMDQDGRVWYTAQGRAQTNSPAFCKKGSGQPSAELFPMDGKYLDRELAVYDPRTKKYTFIDTCFSTQHLHFGHDANNTLWTSNDCAEHICQVVGWLNTKLFLETGDEAKSQGWTALILDTNGNGKRDEDYVEADQPVDPKRDKRIVADIYSVNPSPIDDTVWGINRPFPDRPKPVGSLIHIIPGPNPPATTLAEIFNIPAPGFGPRGSEIDGNGVVWVSLGSGHLGEFDRRKCKGPLNGPKATGDQCPEGWTFHNYPGPGFPELPQFSAESSYFTWVDEHNTSGLGENTPISTGNLYDGLHAWVGGKFVTLRIPYPLGFYMKGFEGRIDDVNAGWKGRGLWVPEGDRTPWHKEGGKGSKPIVVHFQVRPNPLAK